MSHSKRDYRKTLKNVSLFGTIILNMSTLTGNIGILEALFGKTRRSILSLLYGQPDESFYVRKIIRLTQASPGAVQRELKRLSEAGIIARSSRDNRVFFQATPGCPVYIELKSFFSGGY
jgi:DNA-binding transcriptional ArsR family regulator